MWENFITTSVVCSTCWMFLLSIELLLIKILNWYCGLLWDSKVQRPQRVPNKCNLLKVVTTSIVVLVVATTIWVHKEGLVKEQDDNYIILQLHPKYVNRSFVGAVKRDEQTHRLRTLSNDVNLISPTWDVHGTFSFYFVDLVIGHQTFHVDIDSGSPLLWVNCAIPDLNLGPCPNIVITLGSVCTHNVKHFVIYIHVCTHNIIQIHNNVMWNWHYYVEYSSHSV